MNYQCSICGTWVYDGQMHLCGGTPHPAPMPGTVSIPPCRAPWNPLTADGVRLIIREEIERYFANKPEGRQ